MCFGIRFSNPFHLATKIISVQNPNCLKNAKNAWADMIFILAFRSEAWAVLSLHNYIYLIHVITLSSQNITDFKSKQLMKMADHMDLECIPHLWKRIPYLWKSYPHSSKTTKTSCPRMPFCIFMAVWILDGYHSSGQMERAWKSDSKPHVKK